MNATILRRAAEQSRLLHSELGWLQDVRSRALENFAVKGFPTVAEEDWRYTDLSPAVELFETSSLTPLPSATPQQVDRLRALFVPAMGSFAVAMVDGIFREDLSQVGTFPGVILVRLRKTPQSMRDALAIRIRGTTESDSGLTALNAALLQDGLVIDIAADTVLEEPIYVIVGGVTQGVAFNRILIRLGERSRATVIEHHASLDGGITNSRTDIVCSDDSHLTFVKLQAESTSATHLASQQITLGRTARAEILHIDLGAKLARNDLQIELAGNGAEASAHGLFFADGARHLDNHTRIDHCAAYTHSRELYRGIADGHGRGIFNGKVMVHAGAIKSDAFVTNQNLLLSSTAEIDTKPELEIYADDVKCGHGATIGQLDANAIFYLRSRGIPIVQARRMLIASFAREIVKRVPSGPLSAHVLGILQDRLPELREVAASP